MSEITRADEAEKMLMMFVADSYSNQGKPTKKTAIALMEYVAKRPELQKLVNIGDRKGILKYRGV